MTHRPLLSIAAACSREGAGIAEGIAILFMWTVGTIIVVLTIAVISGILVGRRRQRIGHQVVIHVLWGVGLLIVAPFIAFVVWQIQGARMLARVEREAAVVDAWMAPLKNPVKGKLDRALAAVLDADGAGTQSRRLYLIAALPEVLVLAETPLNEQERSAVLAAVRQLRVENERFEIRSHPDNLGRLDGAAAWLLEKPDLAAALQACTGRASCISAVLEFADHWCSLNIDACREGFTAERLAAADMLVKGNQLAMYTMEGMRGRVGQRPARR